MLQVVLSLVFGHGPQHWAGEPEAFPSRIEPMLAQPGGQLLDDEEFVFEPKLDGYRLLPYSHRGEVRLITRGGVDFTSRFSTVAKAIASLGHSDLILDAEIVAFDAEGRPSFEALQQLSKQSPRRQRAPLVLFCFDLLHIAGVNTRGQIYSERRRMLEQAVQESEHLKVVHSDPNGAAMFEAAASMEMEGLVAKRRSSIYQAGVRSSDWRKILAFKRADFLVLGYKGSDRVDALLVGYRRAGRLIYAGEVTGLRGLAQSLLPLLRSVPPAPACARLLGAHWIAPMITVEVRYRQLTKAGKLRHPIFYRLRDEIAPAGIGFPAVLPE